MGKHQIFFHTLNGGIISVSVTINNPDIVDAILNTAATMLSNPVGKRKLMVLNNAVIDMDAVVGVTYAPCIENNEGVKED